MKLTIAIPTYNRNEILKKHIQVLLPQITDECALLILDNCSKTPVAHTLESVLSAYPTIRYRIIRNRANIGGNANILRCIELVETEWVWLLGDDDIAEPNAVETILQDIHSHTSLTHVNYYCVDLIHPQRTISKHTRGLDEYLMNMDSFAASIFISCNVYKVSDIVPSMGYGMFYQYSSAPQFAILAMSLGKEKQCIFSHKIIVKNASKDTPKIETGSPLPIANGLASLLNLPLSLKTKLLINEKVIEDSFRNWVKPESVITALLMEWNASKDIDAVKFKYGQVKKNYLSRSPNAYFKMKIFFYSFLISFPSWGYRIITHVLRHRNQEEKHAGAERRDI